MSISKQHVVNNVDDNYSLFGEWAIYLALSHRISQITRMWMLR